MMGTLPHPLTEKGINTANFANLLTTIKNYIVLAAELTASVHIKTKDAIKKPYDRSHNLQ